MNIQERCYVLLFHSKRKKWLVKVTTQKKMHTHLGVIDVSSAIGLEYGSLIKTTEGKSVYLIQPTVHDFIMKSERKTQIVYPKDFGYIASRIGLLYSIRNRNRERCSHNIYGKYCKTKWSYLHLRR